MKYLIVATLILAAVPAFAQQTFTPSQQMVGQLASALAAANDRVADLEKQISTLRAETAKATPLPPSVEKTP